MRVERANLLTVLYGESKKMLTTAAIAMMITKLIDGFVGRPAVALSFA